MERSHGTVKVQRSCGLTGGMRFLEVNLRSWATLTGIVYPPMGGVSNRGHKSVKLLPPDTCIHIYIYIYIEVYSLRVIKVNELSPVGNWTHSCKELMFHCTA